MILAHFRLKSSLEPLVPLGGSWVAPGWLLGASWAPHQALRFLTIHRFGHQSGRGERSGGLSTAKIHDFSARVFLDRSPNP